MESTRTNTHASWKFTLLFALVFLLFFQLTADFIESIYTFGLLGTNIPPEIISVLFFFSPLLLLFFRRKLPLRIGLLLAGIVAVLRAMEVVLEPSGKMLVSGLAVGLLLITLPVLLTNLRRSEPANSLEMGAGLTAALALSVLLRTLGSGSDISLLLPWVSWLLCAVLLTAVILLLGVKLQPEAEETPSPNSLLPNRSFVLRIPGGNVCAVFCVYQSNCAGTLERGRLPSDPPDPGYSPEHIFRPAGR